MSPTQVDTIIAEVGKRIDDLVTANNREHDAITKHIEDMEERFTKKLESICKRVASATLFQTLLRNWFKVLGILVVYTGTIVGIVAAVLELRG